MSHSLNIDKPSDAHSVKNVNREQGIRERKVIIRGSSSATRSSDQIAEEKAVAMVYNGISHAVMMATPLDLEDFALGFSLTEGIINDKSQLYSVDIIQSVLGFECQMEIPSASFMSLKQRRRQLSGRTGCGICGLESLQAVVPDLTALEQLQEAGSAIKGDTVASLVKPQLPSFDSVEKALKRLQAQQELRAQCGAVHAAAFADYNGDINGLREDVGRHNALDKLLGALATEPSDNKQNDQQGFIVVSSRASYEMVYKTALRGIKTLVAASAPTAMAIELAEQANMNLIGFVREGRQLIYCQSR